MTRWNRSKNPKTCNTFPHVWAAIVGCTGKGHAWRYVGGAYKREAEFACPTCQAAQDKLSALMGPALQAELARLQAAAGVENYRYAETRIVDGRPVLTGEIDVPRALDELEERLRAWVNGCGGLDGCVALIIRIDGDCSGAVQRACSAAQRSKLVAAYRAARAG